MPLAFCPLLGDQASLSATPLTTSVFAKGLSAASRWSTSSSKDRSFLEPGLAWRTLLAQLCQLSSPEVTYFSFTSQLFLPTVLPELMRLTQKSRSSGTCDFHKVRQLSQAAAQQHWLQLQARSAGHTHWTRQVDFPLTNHQWHGAFNESAWPRKPPAFDKNHLLQFCEEFFEDSKSKSSFPSGMVLRAHSQNWHGKARTSQRTSTSVKEKTTFLFIRNFSAAMQFTAKQLSREKM